MIVVSSSLWSARIDATAHGWEKYGSPDWRDCDACISWLYRYAEVINSESEFGL